MSWYHGNLFSFTIMNSTFLHAVTHSFTFPEYYTFIICLFDFPFTSFMVEIACTIIGQNRALISTFFMPD